MYKKQIFVPLALAVLFAIFYPTIGNTQVQASCNISINRSAVPDLYFNNLTLIVQVNDASDFAVISNGQSIPFTQVGPNLIITTDAESLSVVLTPGTNLANLCDVEKAALLDDKRWVWSHGFDDNVNLLAAIQEFRAKSWPATIFPIAKDYDQTREQDWITDEPYVNRELLPAGWALGNHSWNHERFDTSTPTTDNYRADILDAQTRFNEGIARSATPNFKVMVFASPNFSGNYDEPFTEATQTTDLKLLETGNDFMLVVTGDAAYAPEGSPVTAQPLAGRTKIGRDISIEINPADTTARIDWMAANATEFRRFWYNTLSHGDREVNLKIVLDHIWNNYGPNGTNEAWVASSTEVYSYVVTRDNATVSVETSDEIPEINEEENSPNKLYLPMITMMKTWLGLQTDSEETKPLPSVLLKVSGHGLQQIKSAE